MLRPHSVESSPSHVCTISDAVCLRIENDYSFPAACTVRMRFAPKAERAALDIFRSLGNRAGEANALSDLGSALYFLDEYARYWAKSEEDE